MYGKQLPSFSIYSLQFTFPPTAEYLNSDTTQVLSFICQNSYAFAFLKIKLNGINAKTNTKGDKESP